MWLVRLRYKQNGDKHAAVRNKQNQSLVNTGYLFFSKEEVRFYLYVNSSVLANVSLRGKNVYLCLETSSALTLHTTR